MGLSAEAVEKIENLAVKGVDAKLLAIPGDPRRTLLVAGGEHQEISLFPPPRNHEVGTLADVVAAALRWRTEHEESDKKEVDPWVVWHDEEQVVLVANDDDRYDRVRMPLVETEKFSLLRMLAKSPPLTQADMVRLLRNLGRCVPEGTIQRFRQITFNRAASAAASIKHGKESLGRSVEEAVANAQDVPEEIAVTLPVYRNIHYTEVVFLQVEIRPGEMLFAVRSQPDSIDEAVMAMQAQIGRFLKGALGDDAEQPDGYVFYGSPEPRKKANG